jgi:hypothetical protein
VPVPATRAIDACVRTIESIRQARQAPNAARLTAA